VDKQSELLVMLPAKAAAKRPPQGRARDAASNQPASMKRMKHKENIDG